MRRATSTHGDGDGDRDDRLRVDIQRWRGIRDGHVEILRQQRGSFQPVFYHGTLDDTAQAFAKALGMVANTEQNQWQLN